MVGDGEARGEAAAGAAVGRGTISDDRMSPPRCSRQFLRLAAERTDHPIGPEKIAFNFEPFPLLPGPLSEAPFSNPFGSSFQPRLFQRLSAEPFPELYASAHPKRPLHTVRLAGAMEANLVTVS